jgi:glycosyltransferase involved in cell wall biosynthesis
MTVAEPNLERFSGMDPAIGGLTIIVPAYNEEHGIGGVVAWIRQALGPAELAHEILVVDDGSVDRTAELAEQAGARVIRHAGNRGYGEALKTGIQHASHDGIAIIDADGSYPADQIPELARRLASADMVVGARTKAGAAIPLLRRPAKALLAWLASYLTNTDIPDLNSGLRLFRRSLALEFLRILPSGFSFTTTITMAALNNGYIVDYVAVDYLKRTGSSKINPVRDTLNFLMLILRMTLLFRPLKIFIPLSLFFLASVLVTWAIGVLFFQRLFDNLMLFEAQLSVMALWMGMLADLINVRLRR